MVVMTLYQNYKNCFSIYYIKKLSEKSSAFQAAQSRADQRLSCSADVRNAWENSSKHERWGDSQL